MKAKEFDRIRTSIDLPSDFHEGILPAGSEGSIIEVFNPPKEGYIVEIDIPDESLVGGVSYMYMVLEPDEFDVISSPESAADPS